MILKVSVVERSIRTTSLCVKCRCVSNLELHCGAVSKAAAVQHLDLIVETTSVLLFGRSSVSSQLKSYSQFMMRCDDSRTRVIEVSNTLMEVDSISEGTGTVYKTDGSDHTALRWGHLLCHRRGKY